MIFVVLSLKLSGFVKMNFLFEGLYTDDTITFPRLAISIYISLVLLIAADFYEFMRGEDNYVVNVKKGIKRGGGYIMTN